MMPIVRVGAGGERQIEMLRGEIKAKGCTLRQKRASMGNVSPKMNHTGVEDDDLATIELELS